MKLWNPEFCPKTIDELLDAPDDLGLLEGVVPAKEHVPAPGAGESSFLEIRDFVHRNGREPRDDASDLTEQSLARKLQTFRSGPAMADPVRHLDDLGLLRNVATAVQDEDAPEAPEAPGWDPEAGCWKDEDAPEAPEAPGWDPERRCWKEDFVPQKLETAPASIDDILDAPDDLGLLDGVAASIFNLRHVQSAAEKRAAAPVDDIAQRRPCRDFWRFEGYFRQVYSALGTDVAILRHPKKKHVVPGARFILRGQVCYIDRVLENRDGTMKAGYQNRRLHVVFDNGTELDILQYSLTRAMCKDKNARFIDMAQNLFSEGGAPVPGKDRETGFVYVLETESEAPELAELKASRSLVKIGYSTRSVDERIAGAERDQTFLCAPVRKAAEIQCFNMDPRKFETLIHGFLNERRFGVALRDRWTGRTYRPQEWFRVNVETAVEVCRHIVAGDIGKFRIDGESGELVLK